MICPACNEQEAIRTLCEECEVVEMEKCQERGPRPYEGWDEAQVPPDRSEPTEPWRTDALPDGDEGAVIVISDGIIDTYYDWSGGRWHQRAAGRGLILMPGSVNPGTRWKCRWRWVTRPAEWSAGWFEGAEDDMPPRNRKGWRNLAKRMRAERDELLDNTEREVNVLRACMLDALNEAAREDLTEGYDTTQMLNQLHRHLGTGVEAAVDYARMHAEAKVGRALGEPGDEVPF